MEMILQGSQVGYALNVTVGKTYKHVGGMFKDDLGNLRNIGPFAWKTPKTLKDEPEVDDPAKLPSRQGVIDASTCFGTQEDGSHYTDMQLQPLQACYLRYGLEGLRAAIHNKVDKYISRKKNDDVIQLKKALHCMEILVEIAEIEKDLT